MNTDPLWMAAWHLFGPMAIETCLIVGAAALAHRFVQSAQWRRTVWQICVLSLSILVLGESTGLMQAASEWMETQKSEVPSASVSLSRNESSPAGPTATLRISDTFQREVVSRMQEGRGDIRQLVLPEAGDLSGGEKAFEPAGLEDSSVTRSAGLESSSNPPTEMSAQRPSLREELGSEKVQNPSTGFPTVAWLGLAWLVGTAVMAARLCFGRLVFLLFHRRRRLICDVEVQVRVRALAKRLGIRRSIRLIELPRLAAPVAFGWFRPTIALPKNFAQDFEPSQQDAMLVHELAHLAAGDPAWQGVADLVAAALWWHPLVWWSRRRLEAASEASADEASLVVANGPTVLAECLVQLGGRLIQARPFGWLGVEGGNYRSGLGQRVRRLMTLHGGSWNPPHRLRAWLSKSLGPVALAAFAMLCTAWTNPTFIQKGETMKTLRQSWKHLVATLALASAIHADAGSTSGPESAPAPASADPTSLPPTAAASSSAPLDPNAIPSQPTTSKPAIDSRLLQRYGMNPTLGAPASKPASTATAAPSGSSREKVRSLLDQIVLPEVAYDGVALEDVVKDLREESVKKDPAKRGLNFLISHSYVSKPTVDPVTGQEISARPVQVDLKNINIRLHPPLRGVRMKDVLDAITKVADRPIHYAVEDYGVVFARGNSPVQEAPTSESDPSSYLYRMDPRLLERYGLIRPGTTNPSSQRTTSREATRKTSKLESLVLDEVHFDGLPLSEVVRSLYEETRKLDPEKQGVNFILSNAHRAAFPVKAIDPATGRPYEGAAFRAEIGSSVDVNNVIVSLNPSLRNVRLKDVLDAVIKVADQPLKYSAEAYGVVFSLNSAPVSWPQTNAENSPSTTSLHSLSGRGGDAGPQAGVLEVRTFRVDTNTLAQGLRSAFGIAVGAPSASPQFDRERQQIELRLAEMELAETQKKVSVGATGPEDLEKAKAAVQLLKTSDERERTQIRLQLAEQDLQIAAKKFESGRASSLEVERAKAAIELLRLDLMAFEKGIRKPTGTRTSQEPTIPQALGQLFSGLGITEMVVPGKAMIASTEEATTGYAGKTVFYNELTGIVMVRATAEDMKIVQAAIETLGGTVNREGRRTVSVLGGVATPRVIELRSGQKTSILEAIAEAGGFNNTADKNKIEVTRKGERLRFRFDELRTATESDKTFWLEPGDVIHINEKMF